MSTTPDRFLLPPWKMSATSDRFFHPLGSVKSNLTRLPTIIEEELSGDKMHWQEEPQPLPSQNISTTSYMVLPLPMKEPLVSSMTPTSVSSLYSPRKCSLSKSTMLPLSRQNISTMSDRFLLPPWNMSTTSDKFLLPPWNISTNSDRFLLQPWKMSLVSLKSSLSRLPTIIEEELSDSKKHWQEEPQPLPSQNMSTNSYRVLPPPMKMPLVSNMTSTSVSSLYSPRKCSLSKSTMLPLSRQNISTMSDRFLLPPWNMSTTSDKFLLPPWNISTNSDRFLLQPWKMSLVSLKSSLSRLPTIIEEELSDSKKHWQEEPQPLPSQNMSTNSYRVLPPPMKMPLVSNMTSTSVSSLYSPRKCSLSMSTMLPLSRPNMSTMSGRFLLPPWNMSTTSDKFLLPPWIISTNSDRFLLPPWKMSLVSLKSNLSRLPTIIEEELSDSKKHWQEGPQPLPIYNMSTTSHRVLPPPLKMPLVSSMTPTSDSSLTSPGESSLSMSSMLPQPSQKMFTSCHADRLISVKDLPQPHPAKQAPSPPSLATIFCESGEVCDVLRLRGGGGGGGGAGLDEEETTVSEGMR